MNLIDEGVRTSWLHDGLSKVPTVDRKAVVRTRLSQNNQCRQPGLELYVRNNFKNPQKNKINVGNKSHVAWYPLFGTLYTRLTISTWTRAVTVMPKFTQPLRLPSTLWTSQQLFPIFYICSRCLSWKFVAGR